MPGQRHRLHRPDREAEPLQREAGGAAADGAAHDHAGGDEKGGLRVGIGGFRHGATLSDSPRGRRSLYDPPDGNGSSDMTIRPRRTALYVPGSNARALAKAPGLDADVLILDLEDAVAPGEKDAARRNVLAALEAIPRGPATAEIVVRVNGLDTPWGRDDLAAFAAGRADALLLPKISTRADLDAVRAALGPDAPALWAMIETARAVLDPLAIAEAEGSPPLAAFVLGLNDLARETGTRQLPGRAPMLPWMMQTLAATRAAGLAILDGVYNAVDDAEGFAAECAMARDCGFDGKTVIHPAQIGPCNAVFAPAASELAEAAQLVAAFEEPENQGRGAIRLDGRMVERLHAEAARRRLELAGAIEARQAARSLTRP